MYATFWKIELPLLWMWMNEPKVCRVVKRIMDYKDFTLHTRLKAENKTSEEKWLWFNVSVSTDDGKRCDGGWAHIHWREVATTDDAMILNVV